jgi:uncharacterized damage-inducible protein DinB
MITTEYLSNLFDRTIQIIKRQTDGLSQADTLLQLPFRANCLNWVLGHLVTSRNNVLRLLAAEPVLPPARTDRYESESEPITATTPELLTLDELIDALERSQARLTALLATITPEQLARQVAFFGHRSQSVGEWLLFFYFHETYHLGQTEILRQAAGTNDKVI